MTKSAALVYWDPMSRGTTVGERVACEYETSISPLLEAHLEFRSTFTLKVEKAVGFPAAIAFYVGDMLLAVQSLKKFGVLSVQVGDTITIAPPDKEEVQ